MGFIQASDVKELLDDPAVASEIAQAVVKDSSAMDSLADDMAEELEGELESNSEIKRQIIAAAMASPDFRKRLISKLFDDD